MTRTPETRTPDEIAESVGLPLQQALMDFDFFPPERQLMGCDPIELSGVETEPVKSVITDWAVVTILAHQGDAQEAANVLYQRPDITGWITHYAEGYFKEGVMEFAMYAYSKEEIANIEANTGRRLRED